jgi:hypothetical protein
MQCAPPTWTTNVRPLIPSPEFARAVRRHSLGTFWIPAGTALLGLLVAGMLVWVALW